MAIKEGKFMMTYEEMYHEYQKLQAADEIRNLVSNYCFEHNCALQMRYFRNWSEREDIRHEMPWGNTTGHKNLEYNNPWHDVIRHPDDAENMKGGAMFIHTTTTPVIEVAEDLETARVVFLSPGFEGIAAKKMGTWAYSKYAYEFRREHGAWKIWKCRIFPVFRNDYFDDFGQVAEADMTKQPMRAGMEDFNSFFRYGPDVIMPRNEPDPPKPYDTWTPGWNFGTN